MLPSMKCYLYLTSWFSPPSGPFSPFPRSAPLPPLSPLRSLRSAPSFLSLSALRGVAFACWPCGAGWAPRPLWPSTQVASPLGSPLLDGAVWFPWPRGLRARWSYYSGACLLLSFALVGVALLSAPWAWGSPFRVGLVLLLSGPFSSSHGVLASSLSRSLGLRSVNSSRLSQWFSPSRQCSVGFKLAFIGTFFLWWTFLVACCFQLPLLVSVRGFGSNSWVHIS